MNLNFNEFLKYQKSSIPVLRIIYHGNKYRGKALTNAFTYENAGCPPSYTNRNWVRRKNDILSL